MEITSTTLNRTARHTTEKAVYSIDYIIANGKLDRIQLNIFKPEQNDEDPGYLGSVYYDGRSVSCNIPWCEEVPHYFDAAAGFIANIIDSNHTGEERSVEDTTGANNDKSR